VAEQSAPSLPKNSKASFAWLIIRLTLFELVFILAVWAHIKTLICDPGFIPRGYNYNI
jgi:hypothetical protein